MAFQGNWLSKTLVIGIIILFIGMSFTPSVAVDTVKKPSMPISNGNTLYVGGSGEGNYTKIQDAIDNANNGDTVFVYDDSSPYYEILVVDKSIWLIGENKNTTVINGRFIYDDVVTIYADDTIVSGFTITNFDETKRGILICSDNNYVSDCNLIDNRLGSIHICWGCCNNRFSHCYFRTPGHSAIAIHGNNPDELSSGTVISHCIFDEDSIYGIDAPSTIVSDCVLTGQYSYISFLYASDNCQIINCSIQSTNIIAITTECDNTEIRNCLIKNCNEGIRIAYSPENTRIINCTITGCSEFAGIHFWGDSYKSVISGCKLSNNVFGIDVFGSIIKTEIYDCNIANNRDGIRIYFSSYFNRFYRNNFIDNTKQIYHGSDVWFMLNMYKENYWSDWKGILPFYHVYGFLNWDFHPAKKSYKIGV